MRIVCILLLCFFTVLSLFSCNDEDHDSGIRQDIIVFIKSSEQETHSIDLGILDPNGNIWKTLLYESEIYVERLSLFASISIISDTDFELDTGKEFGFMKIYSSKVEFYKVDNFSPTTLKLNCIENLPFTLERGKSYDIGFIKEANEVIFFIKNNEVTFEKRFNRDIDLEQCLLWGKPFMKILNGSIHVSKIYITTPYQNPSISIFGDSFIDSRPPMNMRWCEKLSNKIGSDKVFIDGKSGEKINQTSISRIILENNWYRSKYVIISLGTNDYNKLDSYKSNLLKLISVLKANNQIPILVTVTPRPQANYSATEAINKFVKNSGELYIDMHKAVTEKDHPELWKDGFSLSDGIHPSTLGHEAMYKQIELDIPFIFSE